MGMRVDRVPWCEDVIMSRVESQKKEAFEHTVVDTLSFLGEWEIQGYCASGHGPAD